jgi:TIR domain
MPIFISYSHADREYVDHLAMQLVARNVNVWLDRWEMHVGDSIIDKIQQAITDASALLVILSPNSIDSNWCKKELHGGLIRELEERRIVILPVLLEDCTIPLFLRDKLYADFRGSFDDGLNTILEAVARVTNEWRNRIEEPAWHTDWAIDWGNTDEGRTILRLTLVETAKNQPYTVLTVVSLISNPEVEQWYEKMRQQDQDDAVRRMVVDGLAEELTRRNFRVLLEDQFPMMASVPFSIEHGEFIANISTRLLGMDTGRDVLFNTAQQIDGIRAQMHLSSMQDQMRS